MALSYLKGCTICIDGMLDRGKELMSDDKTTLNKASGIISEEITKELGHPVYSKESVRDKLRRGLGLTDSRNKKSGRYAQHSEPKVGRTDQHSKPEVDTEEPLFTREGKLNPDRKEPTLDQAFKNFENTFEEFVKFQEEFWKKAMSEAPELDLTTRGKELFVAFVKAGFHALSKKHHPDVGGSTEDMTIINNINDYLLKFIS